MTGLKILPLTPDDYESLITLWKQSGTSYRPQGRDSKQSIIVQMSLDPELFLGAFREGRMVGTVLATYDGRRGWINRLAVTPSERRRGIGRMLVEHADKLLRQRGARIVGAHVERMNEASKELFRSCGFKAHENLVYMSKRDSDEA